MVVSVCAAPALLVLSWRSGLWVSGWLVIPVLLVVLLTQARLALAVPAAWRERLGPLRAVRRSLVLTRGHRGRLGVLVLAVWMGGAMALAILTTISSSLTGGSLRAHGFIVSIALVGSLFGLLQAVSTWIVYERIRRIELGNPLEPPIAAIFE